MASCKIFDRYFVLLDIFIQFRIVMSTGIKDFTHSGIAVCDYLQYAIENKLCHIEQNLYLFTQAVGLVLFARMPLFVYLIKSKNIN